MPRGKKKIIKSVKKTDDKVIKDTKKELNGDIEKEQEEIIEPVTFQYVGNLKETTTIVGKITRNNPFTVSDINQINHFRNLNTFEELPKGYKIGKKKGKVEPDIEHDIYVKMAPKKTYSIDVNIADESKTDEIEEPEKDEVIEESIEEFVEKDEVVKE